MNAVLTTMNTTLDGLIRRLLAALRHNHSATVEVLRAELAALNVDSTAYLAVLHGRRL